MAYNAIPGYTGMSNYLQQNPYMPQNQGYMQSQQYQQPVPQQQAPVQMQPMSTTLFGRPVTNIAEVQAAQITFDGNAFLFPDWGHGVIYVKRFDANTGESPILQYRLPNQESKEKPIDINELNSRLMNLENQFNQFQQGVIINDESADESVNANRKRNEIRRSANGRFVSSVGSEQSDA